MLKRERESRGLTLSELSKVTRIPESSLENIENNAFENFPAEVFTRGFLRNYARLLSIPTTEIIAAYENYMHRDVSANDEKVEVTDEASVISFHRETREPESEVAPQHRFHFAYVAMILIAFASMGLSLFFVGTGEAEESDADFTIQTGESVESPFLISNTSEGWIAE